MREAEGRRQEVEVHKVKVALLLCALDLSLSRFFESSLLPRTPSPAPQWRARQQSNTNKFTDKLYRL